MYLVYDYEIYKYLLTTAEYIQTQFLNPFAHCGGDDGGNLRCDGDIHGISLDVVTSSTRQSGQSHENGLYETKNLRIKPDWD